MYSTDGLKVGVKMLTSLPPPHFQTGNAAQNYLWTALLDFGFQDATYSRSFERITVVSYFVPHKNYQNVLTVASAAAAAAASAPLESGTSAPRGIPFIVRRKSKTSSPPVSLYYHFRCVLRREFERKPSRWRRTRWTRSRRRCRR